MKENIKRNKETIIKMKDSLLQEFKSSCQHVFEDIKESQEVSAHKVIGKPEIGKGIGCGRKQVECFETVKDLGIMEKPIQKEKGEASVFIKEGNCDVSAREDNTMPDKRKIGEMVKQCVKEEGDRQRRMKNIVIFRAKESRKIIPKKREEEDTTFCDKLIREGIKVDVTIEKVIRLGKKTEGRDRSMLVRLRNSNERTSILRNSRRLSEEGSEYKNVYIVPDLQMEERRG